MNAKLLNHPVHWMKGAKIQMAHTNVKRWAVLMGMKEAQKQRFAKVCFIYIKSFIFVTKSQLLSNFVI